MTFDPTPDAAAMAVVKRLDVATGGGSWMWRVAVRTAPFWPRQHKAVYFIEAASDTIAAQAGIKRFVAEMKAPAAKVV